MSRKFERYTVECKRKQFGGGNEFVVYGWGTYPEYSVLAGQPMKVYLGAYPAQAEALAAQPEAQPSNQWLDPQVSLNHLPGEDDPVPGGMYPDDWDE